MEGERGAKGTSRDERNKEEGRGGRKEKLINRNRKNEWKE